MTTAPEFDLRAQFEAAERAREAADQAYAALGAAETEAQQERDRRHRQVWQEWADTTDHKAVARAVDDAKAELRRALAETDLGRALVAYQYAIHRDNVHYQLARAAVAAGVDLPDRALNAGSDWGPGNDAAEFIAPVISKMVYEIATERVQAEHTAVKQAAKAAYDSVEIPQPDTFKVVAHGSTEDFTDHAGDVYTHFVADPAGSVAYLDPNSPVLPWYSQHAEFTVMPVFGVPSSYRTAARRMARTPDLYKPGTSGMAGPDADPGAATNPILNR